MQFQSGDEIQLRKGDALLIVDVQNDFLPGGRLAVPKGSAVLEPLKCCVERFAGQHLPIFATRDWHPVDHCSFQAQGGPWPSHCVAGSAGAALATGLGLPPSTIVVSKGQGSDQDAYSGFDGTDLQQHLESLGIERLFVGGLATDYCVLATVRDALESGFAVELLIDAVAAVDLTPGDGDRAILRMRELGAECCPTSGIMA